MALSIQLAKSEHNQESYYCFVHSSLDELWLATLDKQTHQCVFVSCSRGYFNIVGHIEMHSVLIGLQITRYSVYFVRNAIAQLYTCSE